MSSLYLIFKSHIQTVLQCLKLTSSLYQIFTVHVKRVHWQWSTPPLQHKCRQNPISVAPLLPMSSQYTISTIPCRSSDTGVSWIWGRATDHSHLLTLLGCPMPSQYTISPGHVQSVDHFIYPYPVRIQPLLPITSQSPSSTTNVQSVYHLLPTSNQNTTSLPMSN